MKWAFDVADGTWVALLQVRYALAPDVVADVRVTEARLLGVRAHVEAHVAAVGETRGQVHVDRRVEE